MVRHFVTLPSAGLSMKISPRVLSSESLEWLLNIFSLLKLILLFVSLYMGIFDLSD